MATHYQILGLKEDAKQGEIAAAYRRLAKKYHPDLKSGNAEQFRKISDSYQVLSDPCRRSEYDNSLLRGNNIMSDFFYTLSNSMLSGVLLTYGGVFALIGWLVFKEYVVLFSTLSLVSIVSGLFFLRRAQKSSFGEHKNKSSRFRRRLF